MEVRIHIPRPLLTIFIVTVFLLWWTGVLSFNFGKQKAAVNASGGERVSEIIDGATKDVDRERVKQAVLVHREEILRFQVSLLEEQAITEKDPSKIKDLVDARAALLSIIRQRTDSENLIKLSLEQLWEAEGTTFAERAPIANIVFLWPVDPTLGLSAVFEDRDYLKRFGIPHHAIDIPTGQGTPVKAARNGTVLKVALNGMGYSYIVLTHDDQMETVYGHISSAVVKEGDPVSAGQTIALSGGQPGTPGAGSLTTGPHLHFAVRVAGALVDPQPYLPK